MSAIPGNHPIADARLNGRATPPWLQWFTALQTQIANIVVGPTTDQTARALAYDGEAETAALRARVAMLEKRVDDLQRQVPL